VKQIAQAIKQAFMATIKAVSDFLKTVWNIFKQAFLTINEFLRVNFGEIVRATTTIVGPFLIIIGFSYYPNAPTTDWKLTNIGLIILGLGMILWAWRSQIKEIILTAAHSIRDALGAFGHYIWDVGVEIKDAVVSFFNYVLNYWKEILRAITTILSVLLISNGVFLGNLLFLVTGIVILYVTWFSQVNEFLNRTARSIYTALIAFGHYLWDVGVEIKDAVASFFTYVLSLWKEILRAGATIIGIFLILIGISQLDLFPLGAGIVILYAAWFSQVNDFLNRTARSIYTALGAFGHYIWNIGVAIKDAIVNFFRYFISLWREIVRATSTVFGSFLVIIGLYDLLYLRSDGNELLDIGTIFLGLVMISASWRSQIKELLIRTARSIRDALGVFGHYIWNIGVTIKDAIVNFFRYVISLWREIVRATSTVIGVFLVIIGLFDLLYLRSDGNELLDIGLIFLGLVMISASWRSQIKELLIRYAKVLSKILDQLIRTMREISSRILKQLIQIVRTGFDSSITIAIVTLGVLALGYGLILVYSGLFDTSGEWTADIIGIPIVGDIIIRLIGSFAQGRPFDLPSVTNLLGIWVNADSIVLNLIGVMFIGFGLLLPMFTLRKRDSIKISSLKQRFGSSSSSGSQLDYEHKEGIK
jgi:hypothetical protein